MERRKKAFEITQRLNSIELLRVEAVFRAEEAALNQLLSQYQHIDNLMVGAEEKMRSAFSLGETFDVVMVESMQNMIAVYREQLTHVAAQAKEQRNKYDHAKKEYTQLKMKEKFIEKKVSALKNQMSLKELEGFDREAEELFIAARGNNEQ